MRKWRRIYTIILAALTLAVLLAACQPTPDSDIVINKNDGTLESALETEIEYDPMTAVYPEHWEANYEELGGKLTVDIDADVIAQKKPYNAVKVEPYLVPIDQADKIIKALFGTTDVYNYDPYDYTKSEIETLIFEMKARKAEYLNSGDEGNAGEIEKSINQLSDELKTAPEKDDAVLYNHTFTDTSEYDVVEERITVKRDLDDDLGFYLDIANTQQAKYIECPESCILYSDRHYDRETYDYKHEISILGQGFKSEVFTTEEAKAAIETASTLLGEIGAKDRVLQRMVAYTRNEGSDKIAGYRMDYGIQYDDVVQPFLVQYGALYELEGDNVDESFHQPYEFESLLVDVENGEVVYFSWQNIFNTGDIIKENVALLPFEEIMKNVENQLTAKFAYLETVGDTQNLYVD